MDLKIKQLKFFEISAEQEYGEDYLVLRCLRCRKEVDAWLGSMNLEQIVSIANEHRMLPCNGN